MTLRRRSAHAAACTVGLLLVGCGGGGSAGTDTDERDGATVSVPSGWRTVVVDEAALSVPGSWPVVDLREEPGEVCRMFVDEHAVYVYEPENRISCEPLPPGTDLVAGVHAKPSTGDDATVPASDPIRFVTFPEVGLDVRVVAGDRPDVIEDVLATVRPT